MNNHLMNTYARLPVAFERGEGAWLWDESGNRYLDAVAGLGVCALGHSHPEVARVISRQAETLLHTANLAHVRWQERVAEKLCEIAGMDRVFVCNSGAEAIECSFKISRLIARLRGIANPAVVVMEDSFHGRTLAALSATGSQKVQQGFEPLVPGFIRAPFGDAGAVREIASAANSVVAVLLEPIQGESGVRVPPSGYLSELREICDDQGWLLVLDEIQTGLCRTGRWYDCQHEGVAPDILTTAKALGNGVPVAACLARGEAAEIFSPGKHGSTFGGNPLACRTACTVLDLMEKGDIANHASKTGEMMMAAFRERLADNPHVVDIRGRGLMIGIEVDEEVNRLKTEALERGLLMNVTRDNVIRLLPPLIIDESQAKQIVKTVCDLAEGLG